MRSIGIDIGKYSIKVAEIEFSAKDTVLSNYQEFILPVEGSSDTYVDVIEALKKIIAKYDPDFDRFIVGLPQEMVCNRKVIFPFKEKFKIQRTINFELEDDLPFDIDEAIIHPKIIYTRDHSSCIIAFAALKNNIARILELFQDVGIEPDIVSSDGAALANYFENWQRPCPTYTDDQDLPTNASAFLHIGHTHSILAVEMGGHLISLRSIMYGGRDLADSISKKYNINLVEAYKTLKEKAFILLSQKNATQEQITFSNLLSASLDNLASEVKRHMISIEAEEKIHISEVFLSGGLSGIKDISPYFTQALQVSANLFTKDFMQMPMLEQIAANKRKSAIIAVGLAIEGVKNFKNPAVNFRKENFEKKSHKLELFYSKWAYTLKTLGILFFILCVYSFTASIVTEKIAYQSNRKLKSLASNAGLKGRMSTTRNIDKYIRDKKREIKAMDMVSELQDINSPLDILLEITRQVPNKNAITLDVRHWSLRGNEVTMEGNVENSQQLSLIKSALEQVATDGKARLLPAQISKENVTNFRYQLNTKRNVGEL
tara:strand:+ start:9783 stop:11417 length:1635 start_codon:yes stop_codon:yes gene_type:complete